MRAFLHIAVAMLVAACCTPSLADAVPADLGEPIDLSGFSLLRGGLDASETATHPVIPVDHGGEADWIRGYVSGIVGASFGNIDANSSNGLVGSQSSQLIGSASELMGTGGGAVGTAFVRPSGLLRMEVEGRARGPLGGSAVLDAGGAFPGSYPFRVTASNGWSAMTNFWRDYYFQNRFGVYGGGGFGIGGYQYTTEGGGLDVPSNAFYGSSAVTTFAWQAGAGVTCRLNARVTIDAGYRFFAMSHGQTALAFEQVLPMGSYTSAFSANELLLSIRIYDPFRNWQ